MISGPSFSQKNIGGFHILELYQGATTLKMRQSLGFLVVPQFEDSSAEIRSQWRNHHFHGLLERQKSSDFNSQVATTAFWSECRLTSFCFENPGYGHLENFNWQWKTMENPVFIDCPLNPLKIGISHWQLKWPVPKIQDAFSKFKTLKSWICFGFPSSVFWQIHFVGWFMACCLVYINRWLPIFSVYKHLRWSPEQPLGIDVPSPPEAIEESLRGGWGVLNGDEWRFTFWTHPFQPEISTIFHLCFPMVKHPPKKNPEMPALERNKSWLCLEHIGTGFDQALEMVFPCLSNISHPRCWCTPVPSRYSALWLALPGSPTFAFLWPADSIAQTLGFWWFSMFFPTKVFCSFFFPFAKHYLVPCASHFSPTIQHVSVKTKHFQHYTPFSFGKFGEDGISCDMGLSENVGLIFPMK